MQPMIETQQSNNRTILIQNLHPLIDDKLLHTIFYKFGDLMNCKVIIDTQTGISQGYGYLYYKTNISATEALKQIQAMGLAIYGCKIVAKLYKATKQRINNLQTNMYWLNIGNGNHHQTHNQNLSQIEQTINKINLFTNNGINNMNNITQQIAMTNIQQIQKLNAFNGIIKGINSMQQFTIDVNNFINSILPNKQEILVRDSMFKYITACVSELQQMRNLKNRSIRMNAFKFGSELWNVSCRRSDIDIAITVNFKNRRADKQELLDDLLQIICSNNETELYIINEDYIKLLNATYPIIRIQHNIAKIEMDISIADRYCLPTNQYVLKCINKYHNQYKIPIRRLIIFVKYWSKQREINDSYHRYLNSFGYTLMVLYYMKHYILHTNYSVNISYLIYGFFKFYAIHFDFDKYRKSIKENNINNAFMLKYGNKPIEIIDPMKNNPSIHKNNAAVKITYYQRYHIIYEFKRAYHIFKHSKQQLFSLLIQKDKKDSLDFTNVFVTNIPSGWNEKILKQIFEKNTGGIIENIKMWTHDYGVNACLMTFQQSQHAQKAVESLNNANIGNENGISFICTNKLYVGRAKKIEEKQSNKINFGPPKCNLYVGNLSDIVDEMKLYKIFSPCGEIVSIKVIRDINGKSKGYGFVSFNNKEAAIKAIKLTCTKHFGKSINVSYARVGNETNDETQETKDTNETKETNETHEITEQNDEKQNVNNISDGNDGNDETEKDKLYSTLAEIKRSFGEKLYPKIKEVKPELAGKITGMLLELENTELVVLLSEPIKLGNRINEAVALLRSYQ